MANILVTGGTGTLGCAVVSRLILRRHCVRILTHQTSPAVPAMPEGVEVVPGELAAGT